MADSRPDSRRDHDPSVSDGGSDDDTEDESLVDEMRGSGVGVEDPNIVGDAEPGLVDEQVQEDEPPQV